MGRKGRKSVHWVVTGLTVCAVWAPSSADILYEDISYWLPDGTTEINPTEPPTNAWVKIQETVYDDAQGREVLAASFAAGLIHGPAIPAYAINVYSYTITNLTYNHNSFGGITGFNIPNVAGVDGLQYSPNASPQWWDGPAGNVDPTANFEWAIDADMDTVDGDGTGILLGTSFNSFVIVVEDGTPHGFVDGAWINAWDGEGPGNQIDYEFGIVSAPVPEPGTLVLSIVGLAALVHSRRRTR